MQRIYTLILSILISSLTFGPVLAVEQRKATAEDIVWTSPTYPSVDCTVTSVGGHTGHPLDNAFKLSAPATDVRTWGFTTTNTAAANVTAWNANIAAGMKVVIPAGTFLANDTLNIPDNVEIMGMGMGATEIRNTSSVRKQLLRNSDTTNGNQNIYVHDLKLSCTALPAEAEAGNWHELLLFTNGGGGGSSGKNIRVERVFFYSSATPADAGHKALHFRGMQDYTVRDCRFDLDVDAVITANAGTGAQANAYATIQGNKMFTWGTTYTGSAIVVTANHVDVIGNHGLGAGTTTSQFIEVGDTVRWVNVTGNSFQSPASAFVIGLSARDMVIANNTTYGSSTASGERVGISLSASPNGANYVNRLIIANNLMYNGLIKVGTEDNTGVASDITISGNKILYSENATGGIAVSGGGDIRDIFVTGNTVGYGNTVGFYFTGAMSNLYVTNNIAYNNGQIADASYNHGFYFEGLTGGPFYVEGNLSYDNQAVATQKWGYEFSGSPTIDTFTGNKTRGNTTASLVSGSATYLTKYGNKFASSGALNGRATLDNGTVTVSTAEVLANDSIQLSRCGESGTTKGNLSLGTIVAGTSFVINSIDNTGSVVATDNVTSCWKIEH